MLCAALYIAAYDYWRDLWATQQKPPKPQKPRRLPVYLEPEEQQQLMAAAAAAGVPAEIAEVGRWYKYAIIYICIRMLTITTSAAAAAAPAAATSGNSGASPAILLDIHHQTFWHRYADHPLLLLLLLLQGNLERHQQPRLISAVIHAGGKIPTEPAELQQRILDLFALEREVPGLDVLRIFKSK